MSLLTILRLLTSSPAAAKCDKAAAMDEFVNWDNAGAAVGTDFLPDNGNIDLALENVEEDDFSFSALQHFSNDASFDLSSVPVSMPLEDTTANHVSEAWAWYETPEQPCAHCALGAYSCKKIREGSFKGYCTSCVALRVECSFGGAEVADAIFPSTTSTTFSSNNWPRIGENAGTIQLADLMTQNEPTSLGNLPEFGNNTFDNTQSASATTAAAAAPPKIGARFSRDSVRILKNWLSSHTRHPYPSEEEKEMLQRQTGLNKTQITNWLANARRRGKVQPPRSVSPHIKSWSTSSMDIPQRRGTPSLEAMNPLQRWQASPPEHEPASVSAIARAVTASSSALSSGLNSPYSFNYTDDASSKSLCKESSASSVGTSQSSNGSFSSVYSHGSRNSWGSFGSAPFNNRGRRRRRRRAAPKNEGGSNNLSAPLKTFQCTFCTETFRTKHDWQRHEK